MDTYMKYQFQRLRELAVELTMLQRQVSPDYLGHVEYSIDKFVPYWPVSDNWKKKRSDNPFRSLGEGYTTYLPKNVTMYKNSCKETARVWMQFENMIFDHIIIDDDDDINIEVTSLEKKGIEPSIEPRIKIEGECSGLDLKLLGEVKQSSTVRNRIKNHITLHSLLIFEAKQEIEFILEIRKDILYSFLDKLEEKIKSKKFKDFYPTEDWIKRREENRIYLIKNKGREDKKLEKIKEADARRVLLKKVREAQEELQKHNRLENAKREEDALLRKRTLAANKAASKKQKPAHQSPYNSDDDDYNDEIVTSDNDTSDNDEREDNVNDIVMSWYNPNEIYLDAGEEMIRKTLEKKREEKIRKTQEKKCEENERIMMAEQERIQKDHDQKTREADYLSKEKHARIILYSTDCASNQFNEVWTEFKDHYYA